MSDEPLAAQAWKLHDWYRAGRAHAWWQGFMIGGLLGAILSHLWWRVP